MQAIEIAGLKIWAKVHQIQIKKRDVLFHFVQDSSN